uniref:PAS domain S-box protein n=1 Tax=Vibrio mexicanus TaxID=1004326 RepID=UPI00063C7284
LLINIQHSEADTTFIDAFEKHNAVKLLIDPESGDIVRANGASKEFYGYASLTSMKIQQLNQLSAKQVAAERKLAATEGRNFFVFRHKLSDGTIKTVEVRSAPIDYRGRTLLFSIIKDITPERDMAAELWHYQTRLESLVEAQTQSIEKKSETIKFLMGSPYLC